MITGKRSLNDIKKSIKCFPMTRRSDQNVILVDQNDLLDDQNDVLVDQNDVLVDQKVVLVDQNVALVDQKRSGGGKRCESS